MHAYCEACMIGIKVGGESLMRIVLQWFTASISCYFRLHQLSCSSPGSVILSDEWRAYSQLGTVGYTHRTVNHSQCFVAPSGTHTQTVERMWGSCKAQMRQQRTMHSRLFETYLQEYMWRRQYDGLGQNAFCSIVRHISEHYTFN